MKRLFFVSLLCLLHSYIVTSQEITKEIPIAKDAIIEDSGSTVSGNFYILENSKGKVPVKTRYSLWDSNLNVLREYTDTEKFTAYDIDFTSYSGSNLILEEKKGYALINEKRTKFNDENLNGELFDSYYVNDRGQRNDVVDVEFLTDSNFISIGRKEGKEHYKKGKFKEIEIYLLKKNLKTLATEYTLLEQPKDVNFNRLGPKLLHYNEQGFILSYLKDTEDYKRTYVNATYSYNGKITNLCSIPLTLEDKGDKFAILNYGNGSFNGYRPLNNATSNPFDHRTIVPYQLPTEDSKGAIAYDKYAENFYIYTGINPKKGQSKLLIGKYDLKGNEVWKKTYQLEDTEFAYINSFNRFLTFDVSSNYIGSSVFSRKGKNYCDFYLFNKENGELFKTKKFKGYTFYNSSKKYNGLYAQFIIKEEKLKNLIIDRISLFSVLYNPIFEAYVTKLNEEGSSLLNAYNTEEGVNVLRSYKEEKKLFFEKFMF
ncbi:hypothetical protein [uncultured Maribacter sp.]|uniref:hypothetical protein n=1 Tax=uncultured Maribacter sp. TaxID=431308 RepID=UPI00263585CD|nr:hypothetical protein [uncultured Maribacter sp.]